MGLSVGCLTGNQQAPPCQSSQPVLAFCQPRTVRRSLISLLVRASIKSDSNRTMPRKGWWARSSLSTMRAEPGTYTASAQSAHRGPGSLVMVHQEVPVKHLQLRICLATPELAVALVTQAPLPKDGCNSQSFQMGRLSRMP